MNNSLHTTTDNFRTTVLLQNGTKVLLENDCYIRVH